MSGYVYDQAWQHERERLAGLEALQDPGTQRVLSERGVGEGWRCLEIGGGGGSIVEWLAERVGPSGRVVATDLDTRFLEAIERENVEVRRHDIAADAPPDERFDLVHARYVLEHLPRRDEVLATLAGLLAPGGWLVVEDSDWATFGMHPSDATGERVTEVALGAMEELAGFDRHYGRKLPAALRDAGLREVGSEGRAHVRIGPTAGTAFFKLSLVHLRSLVVERGVSEADVDATVALLEDERRTTVSPLTVAAWGRAQA